MKTEVVMKRELFGNSISQCSKSEFLSATDLVSAGNKWRVQNGLPFFNMSTWFQSDKTKEFVKALENKYGIVKINSRGKNSHTWVHPYLFIDMALAISPELKIEVYGWLYDKLLAYRNDSGDSYKRMAGALYNSYPNKAKFPGYIVAVADFIRDTVVKAKDWQTATEDQLKLRDKIHDNIALLADILPCDDAVRIGANKAYDQLKGVDK
jgi:hypothetical protein